MRLRIYNLAYYGNSINIYSFCSLEAIKYYTNLKCYHFHFCSLHFPEINTNLISKHVLYMIDVKGKKELKVLQKCKTYYIFIIIIIVYYYYTLPLPLLCYVTFCLNHGEKNKYNFYRAIQHSNQSAKKPPYTPFPASSESVSKERGDFSISSHI